MVNSCTPNFLKIYSGVLDLLCADWRADEHEDTRPIFATSLCESNKKKLNFKFY
jgi:hypothetical protein